MGQVIVEREIREQQDAAPFIALVVLAVVFSFTGRPRNPGLIQRDYSGSLEFGGLTRTYQVHLPPVYDSKKPTPLLIALHGGGGDGAGMARLTHLSRIADRREFIVVYPDAYNKNWADGRGTTPQEREGVDDVGFISALMGKLASELNIDLNRVYATGISNGGFMSQRLACELSSSITAVAGVAATMPENLAPRCKPPRPVPVMVMHGTEDPLVPWDGGEVRGGHRGKILSVSAAVAKWVDLNGCSSSPVVAYEPDRAYDGTRVRRETYGGCKDNGEVILYAVEGGGHTWPGGIQYLPVLFVGKTSRDIDAGEVIWEFFKNHPKPFP